MFKNNKSSDNSNFWISYADLMAGLLFVFILLIGAIVVKSNFLRNDLQNKKEALQKATQDLNKKKKSLQHLTIKVKEQEVKIKLQQDEIFKLKALLQERVKELNDTKEVLKVTKDALKLKENEINKLNQLLLAKNSKIDSLNGKIIILQNLLQETNTTLMQKEKIIQEYKNKVLILSNNLTKKEDELKLSDKKLKELLIALDNKQSKYEALLKELQSKRQKIKYLTGIKLRVIEELKNSFGNSINITKDGAIRFSSKILFDKDSAKLKESAKKELKESFSKYISALLSNQAIAPNIETIVIEGHTDSDGGFLYNLKLSQDRALAVMDYLLTLDIAKKYNLQKLLTASGRSYLDKIVKNGKEDKEASRRIEIKFRLKNQNALYEIERILDENSSF
jgi:chemotaxis protein MotB